MHTRSRSTDLDYRAFMACGAADGWLAQAQAQLAAWLREKHWDVDVEADGRYGRGDHQLLIRNHRDRHSRSYHARLIEGGTNQGTWTTNLYAQDRRGDGDWLSITVENDRGSFVDVPRLARYLMQALPLGDGPLEFVDEPVALREDRVDDFIDLLCDPDRRGLVFAAGTDSARPFDEFATKVREWSRQVYGLAQVVVLDPAATAAVAEQIGVGHEVPPWTIRTFHPEVDPASPGDSRRHRILGTASLTDLSEGRVRVLLGSIARADAAERPTPMVLVRTRRTFERIENQEIVRAIEEPQTRSAAGAEPTVVDVETATDARSPAPLVEASGEPILSEAEDAPSTVADQVEFYLAELDLVRTVLGVDKIDEATLREVAARASAPRADTSAVARAAEQLRTQRARIEELEDEIASARAGLDEESLERAILQSELDGAEAEVRWLRTRLHQVGDHEGAHSLAPSAAVDSPESFSDLLKRLRTLTDRGVVFTGDEEKLLSLDGFDSLGNAVRATWDTILTLVDYVRARREGAADKNVHFYLRDTPAGYKAVPIARHAPSESDATMNAYGDQRVFRVPADVDPSGRAVMTAHFKLAQIGMVSPRLYYFDDVARTGSIYIGYVGPHLRNTQTN